MIKLVAFDWNGTIIADTKACWEASNQTFLTVGLKPVNYALYLQTFTIPVSEFYEIHGLKKELAERQATKLVDLFNSFYEPRILKVRSRSGVKELLRFLGRIGVKTIIFSNHTYQEILRHLKRLGIEKYFSEILCNDHSHTRIKEKNKEQKLADYIKTLKLKSKEVITVGDSCEEIEIGQKYKYLTVALSGGNYSTKRLKACKPDFLIHNLKDLIPIIKKLNQKSPALRF